MEIRTALLCLAASVAVHSQSASDSYVGSRACYGCHSAIYESFVKTGMGRSMSLPSEWGVDKLPPEATLVLPRSSRTFSVSHSESGWLQHESEPGVFATEYPLSFVVGSGENGLTFLIHRGRYLFQAPLSYYSKSAKWDFSPGYEQVDLGFSRQVPEECVNCHAGRAAPIPNGFGAYNDPPFQQLAIGCENCHGPGASHVASLGRRPSRIVNPAKLNARLAEDICLNCHQNGDGRVLQPGKHYLDFRPGEWLFDTAVIFTMKPVSGRQQETDLLNHFSAMRASRCFRESAGKLSCLTCHDPHLQPRPPQAATYYRAKCLTCHSEQSCRLSLTARTARTPPDDCAGCHMPKRNVAQISHSALTNHRIPAREGEQQPAPVPHETEGLIVVDARGSQPPQLSKITLLRAYRQLSSKNKEYQQRYLNLLEELGRTQSENVFVEAAVGDQALAQKRPEDAIPHLKRALPEGEPIIYLELGQALAAVGNSEDAIEFLKKGIEKDPYNPVMQKTLILQYINVKSYRQAQLLMQQYVADFPEDSFMRNLLARVSR